MKGKRTWIYCRVAHPAAWELTVQQRSLEAYAQKQGLEIIGITTEHASGLNFSRRGLTEVSEVVSAGIVDLLLVKDLSRLGRDIAKTHAYLRWLEDHFVEVICADGTVPQTSREILLGLIKTRGMEANMVKRL